jgi:type I restriction enzyme S subunit
MASDAFAEVSLGDIADFRNGKAISPEKYTPTGRHPVFGSNGQIARSDEVLYPQPAIVIGRVGAYCGCVHYVPRASWITDNAIVALPKEGNDIRFLFYLLGSLELQRTAIGSAQPLMTQGGLKVVRTKSPPLAEQKAIAAVLGALDDKIELNRRMNATLEAMARALFQSWFVDFDPVRAKLDGRTPVGLDPATAALFPEHLEDSPLGHIPKGWTAGTVVEGFNLTMGQSPPGETYNEDGDGIPFYQGRTDFGFRYPTRRIYCTAPTRHAKPGDTLVSVRAPVGDINMADEECCIGRGVAAVRHKSGATSFTYHSMANLYPDFARFEAEGTVFGSINKDSFEKLRFVIPPVEIVAAYERQAAPLDDQIRALEHQSRTLATLRDTLLPKLLSGDLPVSEIS